MLFVCHSSHRKRSLDPFLGVFTGALAYYLHEANPRSAPPPGESISELTRWKWQKWQRERQESVEARDEMARQGKDA